MIIIGNKPYVNLDLNKLIDSFDKNIRLNLGIPGYNNGTKKYIQYLNIHVYDNIIKRKRNLKTEYKKMQISDEYLDDFAKKFSVKSYKKVIRQNNSRKKQYNQFLEKNGCPYKFTKIPRLGCNAIFETLLDKTNTEPIYLINFSIDVDGNKNHLYNNKNITSNCHNINDEINIIKWLHHNKYIDATFCALLDKEVPVIDTYMLKPTVKSIEILKQIYT